MGAKPSGDAIEVAIVVARMAAEFKRPIGRQSNQKFMQGSGIQMPGRGDPNRSIRSKHASIANLQLTLEPALKIAKQLHLQAANSVPVTKSKTPGLLERVANRTNAAAFGNAQKRPRDNREEMRVLVRIEVSNLNASTTKLLNLCKSLLFHLVLVDLAAQQRLHKIDKRRTKHLAIGTQQCRDALRRRDRDAIREGDVTANTKGRISAGKRHSIVERRTGRHQRRRGQRPSLVKLHDGAVNPTSETEVVRIDDESGRHKYLS